jgi:hypothetical protein
MEIRRCLFLGFIAEVQQPGIGVWWAYVGAETNSSPRFIIYRMSHDSVQLNINLLKYPRRTEVFFYTQPAHPNSPP